MCSRAAIGNLAAIQRGAAATVGELDGIGFSCVHVIRESNAIHIAAQTRSPDIRIVDPSCPREDICEIERKIESRRRNHGRAAPDAPAQGQSPVLFQPRRENGSLPRNVSSTGSGPQPQRMGAGEFGGWDQYSANVVMSTSALDFVCPTPMRRRTSND
jgi:hypothetical protein